MWFRWRAGASSSEGWIHATILSYALPPSENEVFWVGFCTIGPGYVRVNMPRQTATDEEDHSLAGVLFDGGWHHLALTGSPVSASSSDLTVYVDGVPVFSDSIPTVETTKVDGGSLVLGQGQSSPGALHHEGWRHFQPADSLYVYDLAEVRLWNIERTGGDIYTDHSVR